MGDKGMKGQIENGKANSYGQIVRRSKSINKIRCNCKG